MNHWYENLMYFHLATVVPAFFLGTLLLIIKKGTTFHRSTGKAYMILMLITAVVSLLMSAHVGPTLMGHFGYIHLFCFLTLYLVPAAYLDVKNGRIQNHKRKMIGLYFGGLIIAGGFTFFPGRYLYQLFFGG